MKVLVTGATGFVGRHLCRMLIEAGHEVTAAVRAEPSPPLDGVTVIDVGELTAGTLWREALAGQDAVVHLAARTHVMHETASNPEMAYRRMNVEVTRRLATECTLLGIKRIVFMSSIKVNGEATPTGRPYTAADTPAPEDAYGRTKLSAEKELAIATEGTSTELTILRPPLVYGPGVKGNFEKLMRAVAAGTWLPLGMIDNRRSLIYVENLCSALIRCLESGDAAGRTYLVSDSEDLSTTSLVRRIAAALGVRPRLLPVPAALLKLAGRLTGKDAAISRLTGSLRVDGSALGTELGWQAPYSVDQGLERTAAWFKQHQPAQETDGDAA